MTDKEYSTITSHLLFEGFDRQETENALKILNAKTALYNKDDLIHRRGDRMKSFIFVLSGRLIVCEDDIDGNRTIMAEVGQGRSCGESLCFLQTPSPPVYIEASENNTEILRLSPEGLYGGKESALKAELRRRFTADFAQRALDMNNRIQILSKNSIRAKLITYFGFLSAKANSNIFTLPLNRENTAVYIGANRSAMCRELAKMKADGIIDYYKNTVKLLKE